MKKGFTLVELLGVIVIIGIIGVIITPLIVNIINDSKNDANEIQAETIRRAAKNYVEANIYTLPEDCHTTTGCTITIKDLKEGGFLENKNLTNAKTNEKISDDAKVAIYKQNNTYKYKYPIN